MSHEREPNKEALKPGQLYFLSHGGHPKGSRLGPDLFSGYGLTIQENRIDRLVGLLMVDRPHPVDPAWLGEIERLYGDYQLSPMTQSGERGILTQMRVEPDSLGFLQYGSSPLSGQLAQALTPLLEQPPAPVLKVRWDEEEKAWRSEFWIGLPPVLQAVFEQTGEGAIPVERDDRTVAFVTHASDSDLQRQLELLTALTHGKCNLDTWFASRIMLPIVDQSTERRVHSEVLYELFIQARTPGPGGTPLSRGRQTGEDDHSHPVCGGDWLCA